MKLSKNKKALGFLALIIIGSLVVTGHLASLVPPATYWHTTSSAPPYSYGTTIMLATWNGTLNQSGKFLINVIDSNGYVIQPNISCTSTYSSLPYDFVQGLTNVGINYNGPVPPASAFNISNYGGHGIGWTGSTCQLAVSLNNTTWNQLAGSTASLNVYQTFSGQSRFIASFPIYVSLSAGNQYIPSFFITQVNRVAPTVITTTTPPSTTVPPGGSTTTTPATTTVPGGTTTVPPTTTIPSPPPPGTSYTALDLWFISIGAPQWFVSLLVQYHI